MIFLKAFLVTLLLLIGVGYVLVMNIGTYDEHDEAAYHKLVAGDAPEQQLEHGSAKQIRKGLQRDIYFSHQGKPIHICLNSFEAELAFESLEGRKEIIEKMHHITGSAVIKKNEEGTQTFTFEAESAIYSYHSNMLIAKNMRINLETHPLGTIQAGKISWSLGSNNAAGPLPLHMDEHVHITFQEGKASLDSHKAEIDFQTLKGIFYGHEDPVVYRQVDQENNRVLNVKGQRMTLDIDRFEKETHQGWAINQLRVDKGATIDVNGEYLAIGDEAIYVQNTLDSTPTPFSGTIRLLVHSDDALCQVTSQRGDLITAKEITVEVAKRQMTLENPQGYLCAAKPKEISESRTQVKAAKMTWDDATGVLCLDGNVEILQPGIGVVRTPIAYFRQKLTDEGKKWHQIDADGTTTLTYIDPEKTLSHEMVLHGALKIDLEKMEVRMISSYDEGNQVISEQQIYFHDAKGEIYADKAFMRYNHLQGHFDPEKFILMGNVKIINHLPGNVMATQYVLADRVDFLPMESVMHFKALPGKRVLFLDQTNSLEVSAPALTILRDQVTKVDTFKGTGDVRFSFVEHEFEQLRNKFSLDKGLEKNK